MPTQVEPPTVRNRSISFALVVLLTVSMLSTALALGAAPIGAAQVTSTADTTATLTPASALAYVSINLDQTSAQWKLSSELLDRAGLSEALNQSGIDGASAQDQLDNYLGGHAALILSTLPATGDLSLDTLTGDVSGAATDPSTITTGDVPSGFAVIFQSPDPAALQKQLDDMLSGGKTTIVKHGGIDIQVITPADPSDAGEAIARVGDSIVVATIADDLFPIIDTANGDVPSLADDASFKSLKSGLNADWISFGLINGTEVLSQLKTQDPSYTATLDQISLSQLDAVTGFAFWADQPGFRLDTLSIAGDGGPAADAKPLSGDFARKVPGDSLFYANGNDINQNGLLDSLGLVFAQALVGFGSTNSVATPIGGTPESMEQSSAKIFQQAASVIGFNIKSDFLDQLTGEFGMAISASDVTGSNPKISAILVTDTADPTKVSDVASKISFILSSLLGNDVLTSREAGGSSITSINLKGSGFPVSVEFGVVNGQLLIGTSDGVDAYLKRPTESLADNAVYKDTLAQLPKDATAISFINIQGLLPLIDEASSALTSTSTIEDNSPDCAKFSSEEAAQAAYDKDQFANFDLDRDYDGTACEDFFGATTPEASPASVTSSINVQSVGTASYVKDGMNATSTIILIGQ